MVVYADISGRLRLWTCRKRLDVFDQREQLLLGDEPLKRRHDGLEAGRNFRRRLQNRLAQIVFIGCHGRAVVQLHRVAEHVVEHGSPAAGVGAMARVARQIAEQLLPGRGQRPLGGAAAQPCLIRGRFHDHHLADHVRVIGSAILRAKDLIGARRGRLEPDLHVAPRNHVGFHAHRGNRKVMDDVFRRHDQLHRPADRHVQLIDFPLAGEVLHLPHPLLADDVDVQRLLRSIRHDEVDLGAPEEDDHRDHERHDRPRELEQQSAVHLRADLVGMPAAEADGETHDQASDENRHHYRQADEKKIESVDFRRNCGRAFRKQGNAEHQS